MAADGAVIESDVDVEDERISDDPPSRQVRRKQTRDDGKLLRRALERFKQAYESDTKQREREKEELEFDAGNQWPEELLAQRAEQTDPLSGKKIPAQVTLTIPRLNGPVYQVLNAQRQASLAITVKPKSGGATQKVAERINGLMRHIQVESRAHIARNWAYDRAVKVGRGYYRILKEYANDGDFDMDLVVSRILNQASVFLDPAHIQPDASDIEWAFLIEDLPAARFTREHGKSKLAKGDSETLSSVSDEWKGWVTFDDSGQRKTVRRAEHWYVTYVEKELIRTEAGYQGLEDDRPETDTTPVVNRRTVRQRKVKWVKLTATEILDREDWEGRYIPIVQVLGREYNVNGRRSYKGMISDGKDAGRSYNYMRSKQVMAVGLAPIAPYTMVEGQDEGYEDMWAQANTVPYARLIYRPVSIAGQPAPPPQRTQAGTDIGAITMAVHAASEDIDSITGFSDPARGRSNPATRSGRMVEALTQRTDAGVSDYLDNLTSISMVHEGRILLDLLPHVYDVEGRVATLLDEDLTTSRQVLLNAPFKPGGPDQPPIPVPPGTPGAEVIDLKQGIYRVVVSTGKSFKTQREEAVNLLTEVISAQPQAASLVMDVLVENIDAPGFPKLARRFKAMLPPAVQQLESEDGAPLPPEAQAQIGLMQNQLQQQQQQMQQMQQALEQKQVEQQAKLELEKMRLEATRDLELAKLAMQERVEMAKLEAATMQAQVKASQAQSSEELRQVGRRVEQEAQLRHDAISQDTQHAHEMAQAALEAKLEREAPAE